MSTRNLIKSRRECQICGAAFIIRHSPVHKGDGRFCSSLCYGKSIKVPLEDRFFSRVGRKLASGCILWAGPTEEDGYGRLYGGDEFGGRTVGAHRVSYFLCVSVVPKGVGVLHTCDNPTCVNPTHLFLGTNTDNVADKTAKGRQARGERHGNAKLTADKVRSIRREYASGISTLDELARKYGVSRSHVQNVIKLRCWRHV
jgi:hypothetical protein